MKSLSRFFLFSWLALIGSSAFALSLSHVSLSNNEFNPHQGDSVDLLFHLDEAAEVEVRWFDGRDLLIRKQVLGRLKKGDHRIAWDGKDNAGKLVPAEAYHYTIIAHIPKTGETVEYDLTDLTGGDDFHITNVEYNPKTQQLKYYLNKPSRVNIRVGFKDGGPLIRTLLDWVPRDAGTHEEPWDGFDENKMMNLGEHAGRMFNTRGYTLPDNTVLVLPYSGKTTVIDELPWGKTQRVVKKQFKKRMYAHVQQSMETRGDYQTTLAVVGDTQTRKDGAPIVSGNVSLELDVPEHMRELVLSRRFEQVIYVDGIYTFENEVGYVPLTFQWDTKDLNEGYHFVTVNVLGYEGNIGMATLKVFVEKERHAQQHQTRGE